MRPVRFGLALLLAVVVAQLTFDVLAGDSGWGLAAGLALGGMAGGLAFTAVNDSPRALWRALVRRGPGSGRAASGSVPVD